MRRPGAVWTAAALAVASVLAVPSAVVLASLARPAREVWVHLWRTQLLEVLGNTLALVAGVGVGTLLVGGGLAWLVVTYRFPGARVFEWALILPLAMPGYVIAFVYTVLLQFVGPVQTWLRDLTEARSLGRSRLAAFREVTLPMARPSLVAGVSLAMMEALADIGTVATFGYRTLTESVYRVWYGMFDRAAAAQLASLLLLFALGMLALERGLRGRARFVQSQRRGAGIAPVRLRGGRAGAASAACAAVLGLAFALPVAQLLAWAGGALGGWR
ncbi:MAG: iron ABC transporter permease, partial [Candidatus Rokubacteria bacterium]|nr:iron ABC transporter permease [Candidatus Rokubacteria bacterium]